MGSFVRPLICVALLCVIPAVVQAAYCGGHPHDGTPNTNPISTTDPKYVSSYSNGTAKGKLYSTGGVNDPINILHVWGTPYEMGWVHGSLLGAQAKNKLETMYADILVELETGLLDKLAPWARVIIATLGLEAGLDATWELVKAWIGDYFVQEMHGLADASGTPFHMIRNIHLLGSLTQGDCSMYGAWGEAITEVTKSTGTELMQLRALDWDTSPGARLHPTVVVYHPTQAGNGQPFINIGWAGWIGAVTGLSSAKMGISEIGVAFPNGDFGNMSRHGYPFTFMLRDILQFDPTLQAALTRVGTANRTCDLLFGVGDGKTPEFAGMAVSHDVFNVYNDTNLEPLLNGSHPRIQNIVYWGMDWACPGYDEPFSEQLHKFYGNISAENTIYQILPMLQTGSSHAAVYDLTNLNFWVAFAQQPDFTVGQMEAYTRQWQALDAKVLFAEVAPADEE